MRRQLYRKPRPRLSTRDGSGPLPVDATGHFTYESKLEDWKVLGHFVTPTTVFVSMNSVACGGGKGSTTLHLKT